MLNRCFVRSVSCGGRVFFYGCLIKRDIFLWLGSKKRTGSLFPVPANAFGDPVSYFASSINTYAAPVRNDANGEFGSCIQWTVFHFPPHLKKVIVHILNLRFPLP